MKMIDPILKIISFQNKNIDTFDQFPIDEKAYTEIFKEINKDPKTSRAYISFKIESSKDMSEIKHGSSTNVSNIFKTLVDNNAFINLNKYSYHREHSIGFFADISLKITLQENLRKSIQDHLIRMDIDDKEKESLVKKVLEKDGSSKGEQRIVLPAFDLHNKEVGHDNGMQRVTTIAYEIRTSPVNALVLKIYFVKYQWMHLTIWNLSHTGWFP